jgi:iron-sulfur cluster assembly protein
MLELSDDAVREIKELTESGGLRFVAMPGEEGSFTFDPSLADAPEDGDVVVERDGARVFLDALAAEKLADVTLEIESHGDHVHFDFVRNGGEDEADDGAEDDGGPDDGPAAA